MPFPKLYETVMVMVNDRKLHVSAMETKMEYGSLPELTIRGFLSENEEVDKTLRVSELESQVKTLEAEVVSLRRILDE